jgi:hypothetical protein
MGITPLCSLHTVPCLPHDVKHRITDALVGVVALATRAATNDDLKNARLKLFATLAQPNAGHHGVRKAQPSPQSRPKALIFYLQRLKQETAVSHAAAPGPVSLTNRALPAKSPAGNLSRRASDNTESATRGTNAEVPVHKGGGPLRLKLYNRATSRSKIATEHDPSRAP